METRSLCSLLLLWWLINCFVVNENQADHGIRIHFAQDPPDQFYKEERAVTTKAPEEEEDDVDDDVLGSLNLLANFRSGGFCCCGCCCSIEVISSTNETSSDAIPIHPSAHSESQVVLGGILCSSINGHSSRQKPSRSKTEKYTSQSGRSG